MKIRWSQLGGQLGIGLAVLGFVLLFLGWNGAASYDRVPAQVPYLISGGMAGLALVVLGGAALIVQGAREDRAQLQRSIDELRAAVERIGLASANGAAYSPVAAEAGMVVAGPTTYHRPTCSLLEGRGVLPTIPASEAVERGLSACRACDPADLALPVSELGSTSGRGRGRRGR
ncbi:MAG: hypothetical protein QOF60_2602 [Actinomycetota bacterium]|nr:hypothetical protein [Actinomycetota bacterium]